MITYQPIYGRLTIEDEDLARLPVDVPGPDVLRSLDKDQRWNVLGDHNNEHEIGGRATDITQLANSVARMVREYYPINEVPEELALRVKALRVLASFTERAIMQILDDLARAEAGKAAKS